MSGDLEPREEIMRLLMDLFARTLDHQGTCLETLGLTYSQAKLLWRLEVGDKLSLKELARRCGVDPSNLAGIVDQLTDRKLVLSRPAAHDKRVRIIPPHSRRRSPSPPPRCLPRPESRDPRPAAETTGSVARDTVARLRELRLQEVLGPVRPSRTSAARSRSGRCRSSCTTSRTQR